LDKTQALLRNNDKTLQRFKRSLESYGDSITLLGTLNNENFSCAKHGQNDFLYLNSDWSLNRVPKYIQMSEKDKEYYIKHLSTKSHGNNGFAPNKPFPLIPIYEIDLPQQ
jgi:predicted P-loop ATPase